jgi:hypothetical protein
MGQSPAPSHSAMEQSPELLKPSKVGAIPFNAQRSQNKVLPWWLQVLHPVRARLMLSRPPLRRDERVVRSSSSSEDFCILVDRDYALEEEITATACSSPNPCSKRSSSDACELGISAVRSANCWGQYACNPGCAPLVAVAAAC